ncbi:MAG: cupin domain-containing protein [candidate division WOR-3 bacterium]|nr:MAG: cupin domain-containing protein [candidate division WOR-3 bacterium]
MYIKHLNDSPQFIAGDKSHLREILHPRNDKIQTKYSLAWATVKPGERTLPHTLTSAEVYFILKGTGQMHINNEESVVRERDTIYIPPNAEQYIENIGDENLEFLCIVDPAWQPEAECIIKDYT